MAGPFLGTDILDAINDMYENWRLKRWETPMSDAKHLFMESLHDHSGLLQIELADYLNNAAIARYKVTFRRYPAYRNIEESYRLELWKSPPCQIHRGFRNSPTNRSLSSSTKGSFTT